MSITERIRYGAVELRSANNRNLAYALAISILVHGGAIALYLVTASPAQAVPETDLRARARDTTRIILDAGRKVLPPLEAPPAHRVEPAAQRSHGTPRPPASVPGATPLVVDAPSTNAATEFPSTDRIDRAGTKGVDGGDENGEGLPSDGGLPSDDGGLNAGDRDGHGPIAAPADTALDATRHFYSDVELPSVAMDELMGRLSYPAIAREHGIEGTVLVRALIGRDGIAERVEVGTSANRILDDAALEAVRATRFTAGRQNHEPVRVWIEIPIRFRLD